MIYSVISEWDADGAWITTVPAVPGAVTQSKRLDLVPGDVAEVISLMTDTDVSPDDIVLEWTAPREVEEAARSTRRLREQAARAVVHANAQTVATLRTLDDQGFSVRDAGALVGVSFQYAARVIKAGRQQVTA